MEHRTEVSRSLNEPATFGARCSCGWVGRTWPTQTYAETDGDEHTLAVAR